MRSIASTLGQRTALCMQAISLAIVIPVGVSFGVRTVPGWETCGVPPFKLSQHGGSRAHPSREMLSETTQPRSTNRHQVPPPSIVALTGSRLLNQKVNNSSHEGDHNTHHKTHHNTQHHTTHNTPQHTPPHTHNTTTTTTTTTQILHICGNLLF